MPNLLKISRIVDSKEGFRLTPCNHSGIFSVFLCTMLFFPYKTAATDKNPVLSQQPSHPPRLTSSVSIYPSKNDFNTTLQKLKQGIKSIKANIFIEIDHQQGARSIGSSLPGNTLIVFGKPQLGTPIMQKHPSMGLDLPLRVNIYEDHDKKVYISFRTLASIADQHTPTLEEKTTSKPDKVLRELVKNATE